MRGEGGEGTSQSAGGMRGVFLTYKINGRGQVAAASGRVVRGCHACVPLANHVGLVAALGGAREGGERERGGKQKQKTCSGVSPVKAPHAKDAQRSSPQKFQSYYVAFQQNLRRGPEGSS